MNRYLNDARKHGMQPGENPPVGLILSSSKNEALAEYALDGLTNPVLARELFATRKRLQSRTSTAES